ncbi:hypothetical protein EDB80DRAFT_780114 [Ilyonectria destructans]|nr:hypothetical protein EDB80DRAFT_780114 [Ilyonectria destructans]
MKTSIDEPCVSPEDTSTITSSLLTPVMTPSERSYTDGPGSDGSDISATESPTPGNSEPQTSASGRVSSRLYRACINPRNRRQPPVSHHKLCFLIFLPMIVFLAVATIGWRMGCWENPPTSPGPNPMDDFVASQEDWVAVNEIFTEYDYLPQQIKSGETAMTDLMIAIKYSDLRGRHRLTREMQEFSATAEKVADNLMDWNSLAGATVDRIQNMNYHALLGYQSLQRMASWTVISAPAAGDVGLFPTLQHFGRLISVAMVGDKEQRAIQLHQLFIQEAAKAGSQLNHLKIQGTALASDFRKIAYHLQNIAEISRSEEAQLKAEVRELLSGIWGWLGFNDYAAKDLSTQALVLHIMADGMMEGHKMINNAMIKIRKLDKDFGRLYTALAESKWEEAGAMPMRLDTIQAAVNRLDSVRKSSRARLQSQNYDNERHIIGDQASTGTEGGKGGIVQRCARGDGEQGAAGARRFHLLDDLAVDNADEEGRVSQISFCAQSPWGLLGAVVDAVYGYQ